MPDPSFLRKAQTLEKWSNRFLFQTFWLVICKFMWIRIRFLLITLMWIRIQIRILIFIWWGSGFLFDPDVDASPGYQNAAYSCGSGSTTLHGKLYYAWLVLLLLIFLNVQMLCLILITVLTILYISLLTINRWTYSNKAPWWYSQFFYLTAVTSERISTKDIAYKSKLAQWLHNIHTYIH